MCAIETCNTKSNAHTAYAKNTLLETGVFAQGKRAGWNTTTEHSAKEIAIWIASTVSGKLN